MPSRSFNGPSCKDLVGFMKGLKNMPSEYKSSFDNISKKTIETVCGPDSLHVWESDSDLDNLIQLTQVMVKLQNASSSPKARRAKDVSMVIIAEERKGRNNFERIVNLVRYLTGKEGKVHLNGNVCDFDGTVVVRGIDGSSKSDKSAAIKRINVAIERVFGMRRSSSKQLVWHQGPLLSLLLAWINTTTPELRNAVVGITITGILDMADGVKPSQFGKPNRLQDMQRLEEYAKKLNVPVVFLDPFSQLINNAYLGTYMYYWAFYINTLLPSSLSHLHYYKALDELITFCYRLRGASESTYGTDTVRMVKNHLDHSKAKQWARKCIDPNSYTKDLCRQSGEENAIHHAVHLADSPFVPFFHSPSYPLPAFSRIAICPSAPSTSTSTSEHYIAAPISISFTGCTFRASSSSPFRILLPKEGQDVEKVTGRIQGTMMGVLERVRQDKGMPRFGSEDKDMWRCVSEACKWALDGIKGKCPKGVEEKVRFVREKFEKGTYTHAVGIVPQGQNQGQGQQQGGG